MWLEYNASKPISISRLLTCDQSVPQECRFATLTKNKNLAGFKTWSPAFGQGRVKIKHCTIKDRTTPISNLNSILWNLSPLPLFCLFYFNPNCSACSILTDSICHWVIQIIPLHHTLRQYYPPSFAAPTLCSFGSRRIQFDNLIIWYIIFLFFTQGRTCGWCQVGQDLVQCIIMFVSVDSPSGWITKRATGHTVQLAWIIEPVHLSALCICWWRQWSPERSV